MEHRLSAQTFGKRTLLNCHQKLPVGKAALAIGRNLHIDQLHADARASKLNPLISHRYLLRARPGQHREERRVGGDQRCQRRADQHHLR